MWGRVTLRWSRPRAGKVMVIDTGRTGREVDAYLRYLGQRNIEVLVVTHADVRSRRRGDLCDENSLR